MSPAKSVQSVLRVPVTVGEAPRPDPTREKLVDAAGRVFAEHGYYATTVREICMRAEANVAAVNYHFGDKLGLYKEVVRKSIEAAHLEAVQNVFDQKAPPEAILRAVVQVRLRSLSRGDLPDWHFRIMVHEFAQPTPAVAEILDEVGRPIYERLLALVGSIIGLAPSHEKTRLCAHSIMGQIFLYVMAGPNIAKVWPQLGRKPEEIDRIAEHIADFSLAYLRQVRQGAPRRKRVEGK
jgi:AcrR family transcriptional regulator